MPSAGRAVVEPPVLPGRRASKLASTLASAAAPSSDVGALVVVVVVCRPAPGRLPLIKPANPLPVVVVVVDVTGEAVVDVTSTLDGSPSSFSAVTEAEAAVVVLALPAPGRLPPKRLDKPADGVSTFSPWTGLAVVVVVVRPAPGRRPPKSPANPVLAVAAVVESTADDGVRAVLVRTAGLRAISPANAFVAVLELTAADEDSVTVAALNGRLPPNEDDVDDSIGASEL